MTQQQVKVWCDHGYFSKQYDWYDSYKKGKAQNASMKEELTPIAWHSSRWWDWYVPEDEKKEAEKLWG